MDKRVPDRGAPAASARTPRVGFLGTGEIGRQRMAAICATGAITPAAFCDPSDEAAHHAGLLAPAARRVASFEALLDLRLDGIVIATPVAGRAAQSIAALERGAAVFGQAPLGRSEAEAAAVVRAAQAGDRLLGIDLPFRDTAAAQALKAEVARSRLGSVFALDLVFHQTGGPDQPWRQDRTLAGGGCLADPGVHLLDLALWLLGMPAIASIDARLHAGGAPARPDQVEDYAAVQMALANGTSVRLACSWRQNAGVEADIAAIVHGTRGSAGLHNVGGSCANFTSYRNVGARRETLVSPPDERSGGMAAAWACRLAADRSFDPTAEAIVAVAGAVERIYRSGFSLGIDGRRYQSVEPFLRPAPHRGNRTAEPLDRYGDEARRRLVHRPVRL